MKLLITIENIKEFRPLSASLPAARLQPYIQEAQQLDLKRLLGNALYYDFMTNYDNVSATYDKYRDLLNGKAYTYAGNTVEHPGLTGYLSYCTLARFMANNQVNATSFGVVQKDWDGSTPVDAQTIRQVVSELRSNALALEDDIRNFLSANATTYSLWAPDGPSPNTGAMFFDPDDAQAQASNGRTLISW